MLIPFVATARRTALLLALSLPATSLAAQHEGGWQLRIPSGRMVTTGSQRAVVQDAPVVALQVARSIGGGSAVTTTLGWGRSRDLSHADAPRLDILSADLGLEQRVTTWHLGHGASFTPFVGVGGGIRQYDSRLPGASASTASAAYIAAGGELGIGRVGIRLEARNYATDRRGPAGLRNDVAILGALRFNRRSAK